jgi:hypothetical protein
VSVEPGGGDREAPPAGADRELPPAGAIELTARLALGLAEIGGRAVGEVAVRAVPAPPRRTRDAAGWMSGRLAPARSLVWERVGPWYQRGVVEQGRNRELAESALRALIATVATTVLDEIDLDEIADRIDVGRLVDRVDLDEVVARVDLDRVVERLDMDAIVERVDLSHIARQVLEEVDFDQMIRESTSSFAGETLDALRSQGTSADHFMGRLADRIRRRREEDPPSAPSAPNGPQGPGDPSHRDA